MLAAYYSSFGGPEVIKLGDQPAPLLGKDEILVKVRASALNPVDYRLRQGQFQWALRRKLPKLIGADFAGEVVQSNHPDYRKGQAVFGQVSALKGGAHAQLLVAKPHQLAPKPDNLIWEEAAALPLVSSTVVQSLRDWVKLQSGETMAIIGGGGGVGTMAIQYARHLGATVTAVGSTGKQSLMEELGADHVVDYTQERLTGQYDVVFDAAGQQTWSEGKNFLKKGGRWLTLQPYPKYYALMALTWFLPKKLKVMLNRVNAKDMQVIRELAETAILQPVIDSTFTLEDVQKAYERLESGHCAGKVVLLH